MLNIISRQGNVNWHGFAVVRMAGIQSNSNEVVVEVCCLPWGPIWLRHKTAVSQHGCIRIWLHHKTAASQHDCVTRLKQRPTLAHIKGVRDRGSSISYPHSKTQELSKMRNWKDYKCQWKWRAAVWSTDIQTWQNGCTLNSQPWGLHTLDLHKRKPGSETSGPEDGETHEVPS